jgi:hypothetical protein
MELSPWAVLRRPSGAGNEFLDRNQAKVAAVWMKSPGLIL